VEYSQGMASVVVFWLLLYFGLHYKVPSFVEIHYAGVDTSNTKDEDAGVYGDASPCKYLFPALQGGDTGVGRCE
jgi:hypothetical protein